MDIGIVGAGNIGANLARGLVRAGHRVKLANSRGPETIRELASGMGANAVTVAEAVKDVAVIILSIPFGAVAALPPDLLADVPEDVIVIDTGNYYPALRDPRIEAIEGGMPESLWVSRHLGRDVVKAINSISFTSLADGGRPAGTAGRIALPVAGDQPAGKRIASALLDELGFDGVDAGGLADSWRQQPGTPTYCTDLDVGRVKAALALADRASAPERRDRFVAQMLAILRRGDTADLIALGRSIYGAP